MLESKLPFKSAWHKISAEPQFLNPPEATSPPTVVSVKVEGVMPGIRWAQGQREVRVNTWEVLRVTGLA